MDSRILQFFATLLVAIIVAQLPLVIAFQLGFVSQWWGQDAESYFGLLLGASLMPVLVTLVVSLSFFFFLSVASRCRRWFLNGVVIGALAGICLLVWIDQYDRWTTHPWLFYSGSLLAACGICVSGLLLFNHVTEKYSGA